MSPRPSFSAAPRSNCARSQLACTVGTVRNKRRAGPNQWRAEFVAPRSGAPGWVLCGALGSGGATALLGLELQRRDMLALNGLPSLSRVLVKMGETVYGPVRANAVGYVELPVVLTPAHSHAQVQATPPGKPTETRDQPLSVSTAPQVLLLLQDSLLVADGAQGTGVYAFTLGERGEPQDLPATFSATEGALSMKRTGTGLWAGQYTPPPRLTPGEATLAARLGPGGRTTTARVELRKGLRPALSLEAPPQRVLLADGLSTVELRMRVADQHGRVLAGQAPRLTAPRGQVGPVQERAPGLYVSQYTVPSGGMGPVKLTAELPGAEPASVTFEFRPPPRISLSVDRTQLPADGTSHAVISIIARDPEGRELPEGTPVLVSTTLGTVPSQVRTSGGRAFAELVAGKAAGEAVVQVTALDAVEQAHVRLVPGAPAHVAVQTERSLVLCDGRDGTDLHLFVRDANGNGLDSVPIRLELAGPPRRRQGWLDRVAALGKGEFISRYHAPEDCTAGPLAVEAVAGELRAEHELQLSRSFPRLVGVTARVGAQHNLANLPWLLAEVEAETNTGLYGDRLLATGGLQFDYGDFTFPKVTGSTTTANARVRILMGVLSLGPRLTVFEHGGVTAYVGAGIDGYLAHITETLNLGQPSSDNLLPPPFVGAHARAGVGLAMGPGSLVLQVRYALARLEQKDFRLDIEQVAGLSGSLGYRFTF